MTTDKIYRISSESEKLRIYAVDCTNVSRELCILHEANPHSGRLFAESLSAALLLSATLKTDSDQNLTYRFQGNGKVRQIIVQVDARGNVRGYISDPHAYAEGGKDKIFSELIGPAPLNITKDLGFGEPYTGVSPVLYGSVAKDTANDLTNSEQIPSAIVIGTSFNEEGLEAAGGFLIQSYPDTPLEEIEKIEAAITSSHKTLSEHLGSKKNIIEYLQIIFGKSPIQELSSLPVNLSCRCSRELLEQTFARLETAELLDMIKKDEGAEASCSFCKKKFHFSVHELQSYIDAKGESEESALH